MVIDATFILVFGSRRLDVFNVSSFNSYIHLVIFIYSVSLFMVVFFFFFFFFFNDTFSLCLTMTYRSVLKDHNGNKRNHFLFIVSSLVVISKI